MRLRPASLCSFVGVLALCGCAATETSKVVHPARSAAVATNPGSLQPVSVGLFENRSDFMRGVFSDDVDRLGAQARTSLVAHLGETRHFTVLDRDNAGATAREAALRGKPQAIPGANFVITGAVTQFGRKEVGDTQFFGLLGQSRTQAAYASVTLNLVDSVTSVVVYSTSGTGEVALTSRDVLGFGSTANYDSTLNAKVLDLAMSEAVAHLVASEDAGLWGAKAHP